MELGSCACLKGHSFCLTPFRLLIAADSEVDLTGRVDEMKQIRRRCHLTYKVGSPASSPKS
jgi:hypothetical protein